MTSKASAKPVLVHASDAPETTHPSSLFLISLLDSHASLVSEHTEIAALNMSQHLSDLRAVLTEMPASDASEAHIKHAAQLATEVQMVLQYQDRVRQQLDVIRAGIALMAEAHPPPNKDADEWVEAKLANLSQNYVMQEQWDMHNRHLGIVVEDKGEDDDMTFF